MPMPSTWADIEEQVTRAALCARPARANTVATAAATSHHRRRLQRAHVASHRSALRDGESPQRSLSIARSAARPRSPLQRTECPASPPRPMPVQRGHGVPQSPFASQPREAPFPACAKAAAAEAVKRGTGVPRALLAHPAQPRAHPCVQADAPVQRPRVPEVARPLAPSRVARQAARARLRVGRIGSTRASSGRWDTRKARRARVREKKKAPRTPRWLRTTSLDEEMGEMDEVHGSAQRERRRPYSSTRSHAFLLRSGATTLERPLTARERRGAQCAHTPSDSSSERKPCAPVFMSTEYLRDLQTMRLEAAARSRRGEAIRAERGRAASEVK